MFGRPGPAGGRLERTVHGDDSRDPMNVRLVYRKIEHHASHSGYDRLAQYVQAKDYRPGVVYRIASKLSRRVVRKFWGWPSMWYRRESL